MRPYFLPLAVFAASTLLQAQNAVQMPAAAKGEVLQFSLGGSTIFPGTARKFWVYVPANYRPETPACLYVHQDGITNDAPNVFDNLIASGVMPVTIGVFVQPGRVKAVSPNTSGRINRSFEYESLSPDYEKFLETELLPAVESQRASDGRSIHLSKNPNDRAIGGQSSGALAALNAAFERPDLFSRVFSCIGSYTDLRGGDRFPSLIRKTEPKPVRVFIQDGAGDLNNSFGDWWMANQTVERALQFAGYEVEHAWGVGGHDAKESDAIFPDAMRFLWKDWPKPVPIPLGGPVFQKLLLPGEGWSLVSKEHDVLRGPATNSKGELFFNDIANSKTYRLNANNAVETFVEESGKGGGQAFGPDGRLFAIAEGENKIVAYRPDGSMEVFAEGFHCGSLIIRHDGKMYVTEPRLNEESSSGLWLILPDGTKRVLKIAVKSPSAIALSPDQSLLYIADSKSRWVYSYQIQPGGLPDMEQRFFQLALPDYTDDAGAEGLEVDTDGQVYVATRMGIQVCDPVGRVQCILSMPEARISSLAFGGPQRDILYAACGNKLFKRQLRTRGAVSFTAPVIKPQKNGK